MILSMKLSREEAEEEEEIRGGRKIEDTEAQA